MHYLKNISFILFFLFPLTFSQTPSGIEKFNFSSTESISDSGNYSLYFPGPSMGPYVGDMTENIITGSMSFTIEAWVKSPVGTLISRGVSQYDWVYNIYASDESYGTFEYLTTTTSLSWSTAATDNKKFFYVASTNAKSTEPPKTIEINEKR